MSRWVGIRWVSVGWVCGPVGLSRVGVCGPVGAGGTRVLPSPVAGGFTCRLYLQPPGGRGSAGHAPLPLTERSPRVAARDSRWQGFPLTPPPRPAPSPRAAGASPAPRGKRQGRRAGRGAASGPGGGAGVLAPRRLPRPCLLGRGRAMSAAGRPCQPPRAPALLPLPIGR